MDRRPRRRLDPEQRRAAILDAARDAFAHAPYESVSIAGIAAAAGSSEALVHRYFASKGVLYLAVLQESIDELLTRQVAADTALGSRAAARRCSGSSRRRGRRSIRVTMSRVPPY